MTRHLGCLAPGAKAVGNRLGGEQMTVGSANRDDEAFAVRAQRRAIRVGAEKGVRLVPDQLAAAVGPQVHHGGPAARHGNAVAGDRFRDRAFAVLRADLHPGDAFAAIDGCDPAVCQHFDAKGAHLLWQLALRRCACVDHGGHV